MLRVVLGAGRRLPGIAIRRWLTSTSSVAPPTANTGDQPAIGAPVEQLVSLRAPVDDARSEAVGSEVAVSDEVAGIQGESGDSEAQVAGSTEQDRALMEEPHEDDGLVHVTKEQREFISGTVFSRTDLVRLFAFAGTGKTYAIREFAWAHQTSRILYLAVNKSACDQAKMTFPPNVHCRTINAIAFECCSQKDVRPWLTLPTDWSQDEQIIVGSALERWMHSARTDPVCLDDIATGVNELPVPRAKHINDLPFRRRMRDNAQRLWERMIRGVVDISPSAQVKALQIAPRQLGYDIVILDDAQDASAAAISIVALQKCTRIFVGDRNQKTAGFPDSLNALDEVNFTKTFDFSCSFRVPFSIATLCNEILAKKSRPPTERLESDGHYGEVLCKTDYKDVTLDVPVFIGRTTASIVMRALDAQRHGIRVHFIGGKAAYKLQVMLDVCLIREDKSWEVQTPTLKGMTFYQFRKLMVQRTSTGIDSARVLPVPLETELQIAHTYELVKQRSLKAKDIQGLRHYSLSRADLILGTVHQAKGMEFDVVELGNDFIDPYALPQSDDPNVAEAIDNELNLLYLAASRASRTLVLPPGHPLLRMASEHLKEEDEDDEDDYEGDANVANESDDERPSEGALDTEELSRLGEDDEDHVPAPDCRFGDDGHDSGDDGIAGLDESNDYRDVDGGTDGSHGDDGPDADESEGLSELPRLSTSADHATS
ncbi:UvrD-like helicase C-terminal domain-containing protein [Plasmodiophora brassicae]|nr:hypothetical protein PBRA_005755 [Plasmodiophora brassicae]